MLRPNRQLQSNPHLHLSPHSPHHLLLSWFCSSLLLADHVPPPPPRPRRPRRRNTQSSELLQHEITPQKHTQTQKQRAKTTKRKELETLTLTGNHTFLSAKTMDGTYYLLVSPSSQKKDLLVIK